MKIKDLSVDCRPRERMFASGASSLNNAELLSILLACGTRQCSALELAHRLLSASSSLSSLASMSVDSLCSVNGIGRAKAAQVAAALELGRRFVTEFPGVDRRPVLSPRIVFDYMMPVYKSLDREQCWVLFLNSANYILSRERLTEGDIASTTMDVRRIVKLALEKSARGVIVTHNHPSGDPSPSKADIRCTTQLKTALATFEIALLDHIVVSDAAFYSFAEGRLYSF